VKRFLAIVIGVSAATWAHGEDFSFAAVNTRVEEDVVYLNARVDYGLSAEALEALESGVPLTMVVDIEVLRDRRWWWDKKVAALQQRYQLLYHALSNKYIVRNLNSGSQRSFPERGAAQRALGEIEGLPMLDRKLLEPDAGYWARIRASLDIESLPAPMRPLAYISSQWRLDSNWYSWRLQP
jgi:hypothetical protein